MFRGAKNLFNARVRGGIEGTAVVQSAARPSMGDQGRNADLWLDIYIDGRDPYRVEHQTNVDNGKLPSAGDRLRVMVAPDDPERIWIDWDAAPDKSDAFAARMAAGQPAPSLDAATGSGLSGEGITVFVSGDQDGGSETDQLRQLAELHAQGALTDEEFARTKARLLPGG